ncbi:MAG: hypothetical protein WCR42_14045 [bacterium]
MTKSNIVKVKVILTGIISVFLFSLLFSTQLSAQDKPVESKITKNDGAIYIGVILANDEKGVLIETKDLGKILIPKYEIKAIEVYDSKTMTNGTDLYSTRYFISTNGLPIKKGDDYMMLSPLGAEAHFAVSDNFSLGIMTSWLAVPIIGSAKYSINLGENFNLGLGALVGTASWAGLDGYGFLGYGSLTYGNRQSNISVSGGYGVLGYKSNHANAPLMSIAGMTPITKKVSFVFDSFIYLDKKYSAAMIVPGLRFATSEKNSFQFGFMGLMADGKIAPFPFPMLNWLRAID